MAYIYLRLIAAYIAASLLLAWALRQDSRLFRQNTKKKAFFLNALVVILIYMAGLLPIGWAAPQKILLTLFLGEFALAAAYGLILAVHALFFARVPKEADLKRRDFLKRSFLLPITAVLFYSGFYESEKIIVRRYRLLTTNEDVERLCIAQLSDVHLGRFFSLAKFRATLEQIAALQPELLAVTGDIFDCDEINDEAIAILAQYCERFPQGIYYCWGNHEYRHRQKHLARLLENTKINVLTNRHVAVKTKAANFYLAGVDYPLSHEHRQEQCRLYAQKAFSGLPQGAFKILLAHHSDFLDEGFLHGAFLTLTGHTHGGQFCFLGKPIFPFFKYMKGIFQNNNCYGYVNVGAGSWFPYRFDCPPEISLFEIRNKKKGGKAQEFA